MFQGPLLQSRVSRHRAACVFDSRLIRIVHVCLFGARSLDSIRSWRRPFARPHSKAVNVDVVGLLRGCFDCHGPSELFEFRMTDRMIIILTLHLAPCIGRRGLLWQKYKYREPDPVRS